MHCKGNYAIIQIIVQSKLEFCNHARVLNLTSLNLETSQREPVLAVMQYFSDSRLSDSIAKTFSAQTKGFLPLLFPILTT